MSSLAIRLIEPPPSSIPHLGPDAIVPRPGTRFLLAAPDWHTLQTYTNLGTRLELGALEPIIPGIAGASGRIRSHSLLWRQRVYPGILSMGTDIAAFGRSVDQGLRNSELLLLELTSLSIFFGEARRQVLATIESLEARAAIVGRHADDVAKLVRDFSAVVRADHDAAGSILAFLAKLDTAKLGKLLQPIRELLAPEPTLRPHIVSLGRIVDVVDAIAQEFESIRTPVETVASFWNTIAGALEQFRLLVGQPSVPADALRVDFRAVRRDWRNVAAFAERFVATAPR